MTTTVLIKQIEWSENPTDTSEAILLQVQVAKIITTSIAAADSDAISGAFAVGQKVATEEPFTP
jgi:uncharacterized protein YejL (UPF0352 family)